MSYVSLARKYRPRRFADMVGQESTTLALTNAIRLRREPHSVIFTGVRGVGKTTSARIYAKALNCEKGPTTEPCDICASCAAIVAGNHEDVLEIDGASNTGVDDVRALQETLGYVPQRSTYKIYIIDEVHMLSISAFNALLKTLEEPPQHVVFIFATTELHKVPETIQSRCQTFHLQKISRPVIAERIRSILTAEGVPFDEAALALVAREGRGSMRDALTMLDQAIAVGGGQVSLETLRNMVGGSSQALPVLELLDGLLRKDAAQILEVIARWDQEGQAMSTLVEETAKACRNAFILRDLKGQAIDLQLLELEDREQQMLLELGEKAAPLDLNRLFRQLAKCLDDLRHADLDRFILENYCLEWCFDPGLPDLQTLMNILANGQPLPQIPARPAPQATAGSEGAAVNLRERWKTASPSAPSSRPAAPSPAPAARPVPQEKTNDPQPGLDKPIASAGSGMTHQAPAGSSVTGAPPASSLLQKLSMAQSARPAVQAPVSVAANMTAEGRPDASASLQKNPLAPSPSPSPSSGPSPTLGMRSQAAPLSQPSSPGADLAVPAHEGQTKPAAQAPVKVAVPASSPAARPEKAQASVRTGAVAKGPAMPPEPTPPPFDMTDDDVPPWLLQEEAGRQGAVTTPSPVADPGPPDVPKAEGFLKQMARTATAPIEAPASRLETPAAAVSAADNPIWPESWRAFVEEWKKQKPLQGRILEEAYVLEYSPGRIRLAVEPSSMAGGKLLQQDVRKRLMEQFVQLFGFKGILEAVPKADAHPGKSANHAPDLGETLLDVKNREREVAREQLKVRLEEHPMTREVISRFGGTIEQIELQ